MKKGITNVIWFLSILLLIASPLLISYGVDTATAAETPKYGGTLVIRHTIPQFLGYPAKARSQGVLDHAPICVDPLLQFGRDGKPKPWLATSWQYSADMKSLTLKLRQGVKFHDGTDFNAAAVKTNLDLYIANRGELNSVSSVDVVDNYTVRLNLSYVDAYLLTSLGEFSGYMISPAALAKGPDYAGNNPVGTGPFKQVSYKSGVSNTFEKWDGYWQKGKPYLDAIKIVSVPNDMTALAAYKKGEIHIFATRDAVITKGLKDANISLLSAYIMLVPDSAHKDSPFSDLKVRQAVAYAIDVNTLQKSFGVNWEVSNQVVDKSSAYYNPDIKGYPYNLEKAKELMAASKYPKGFKIDITHTSRGNAGTICAAIQSMLAKINVQANLKSVGNVQATALRRDGWENGLLAAIIGSDPAKDPGRMLMVTFSPTSGFYKNVHRSAKYDAILDKTVKETDFDKRVPLMKQLMKQLVDEECMFYLVFNHGWLYIKSPKLKDSQRGEVWYHQWTPEDAWFDK